MINEMDDQDIARLISAAGGDDVDLDAVVVRLGPVATARLLVNEIVCRCDDLRVSESVSIAMEIEFSDGVESQTLLFGPRHRPRVAEDGGDVLMCFTYDAADLIREVYGPRRAITAGIRRVELRGRMGSERPAPPMELWKALTEVSDAVSRACSARCTDLAELAIRYGSDKWGGLHWFTPHYERHLERFQAQPLRLLEIGVGGYSHPGEGGASLQMWRQYFRRGLIYGLDVFDKSLLDGPRLRTVIGDQSSRQVLADVVNEYGPFDVIIDDGSHINEHVLASFDVLFPAIRPGGVYVIEDLWTSYAPGYGGRKLDLAPSTTSLGLTKALIDAMHHEEKDRQAQASTDYVERHIVGVHVYHNIAFLEKGTNAEGGIPGWIPHSPDW